MLFSAFADELIKLSVVAGGRKVERRVDYLFSPKAGPDKWDKFLKHVRSPEYAERVVDRAGDDPKMVRHTQAMHGLSRGKVLGKVQSARLPGRSYEVRKMADGRLGCTCPDWRFVGSVDPGHDCKHIKAFRAGKSKVAMSFSEQTSAFFDELENIINEQKKSNQGEVNPQTERPYSSLLTQDEEPTDQQQQPPAQETEPEVITRYSGGGF
jgi:hypothetical protein